MNLFIRLSFILFLAAQLPFSVKGQVSAPNRRLDSLFSAFGRPGYFVLKGKVSNTSDSFFEFGMTSYFDNELKAVSINADGTFQKSFPISNSQDIYLYINNDAITFTVKENDTLTVNWDEKDFSKTFSLTSNNPLRNTIFQTQYAVYIERRKPLLNLSRELYEKRDVYSDEQKFRRINEEYNKTLHTILSHSKNGALPLNNLLASEYFTYTDLLRKNDLLPNYKLAAKRDSLPIIPDDSLVLNSKTNFYSKYRVLANDSYLKQESEQLFTDVAAYRDFIFDYLRFRGAFTSYVPVLPDNQIKENFTLKDCYTAKANLSSAIIQDWFVARSIKLGFEHYDFGATEEAYKLFMPTVRTKMFKEMMQENYASVKLLKPGSIAPGFTLEDENGKKVSLADFKGKTVYIDFWGVYCGPCIYDIQNGVPKMHEYYKDKDVVFVNICVDVNKNQWKEALKKYNLHGVNLIAEGWTKHPVCKLYNVNSIPHYIMIDKAGKILDNNSESPSLLSRSLGNNDLDVALKASR